jgi:elongation factor 2
MHEGPAISVDPEEVERLMTIFTSLVTLAFEYQHKTYLFQINDTPGHLSFTGEVSRALRGSDGVMLIVDALEGMMTQTETNMQLALQEEYCKPVLFINKIDRLLGELELSSSAIYSKLDQIVGEVNTKIRALSPEEFRVDWQISFRDNSVAVGSSKHGWGFTVEILKEKGLNPENVFERYRVSDMDWLKKHLPLDEVLLRLVIKHLPSPDEAQAYKIPQIWSGPLYMQSVSRQRIFKQISDDSGLQKQLRDGLETIFRENGIL